MTLQEELRGHAKGARWTPLDQLLADDAFFGEFQDTDAKATRLRRIHRWMTRIGAALGTLLLLVALAEEWLPKALWVRWTEIALGSLVIITVVAGKAGHFHHRWLSTRVRAERLRLLFFSTLADPEFWRTGRPRSDWPRLKEVELKAWAKGGSLPDIPAPGDAVPPPPDGLARFYEKARLATQIAYFETKRKRETVRWWDDPAVVQFVFFSSIVCILLHAFIKGSMDALDKGLLTAAAVLPTLYAGFKTLRSSNEFARNTSRAQAKLTQLIDLQTALKDAKDPWTVLMTMRLCEALLEEEQREWARLMTEAEWFG